MEIIFLFIGLLLGFLIAYFGFALKKSSQTSVPPGWINADLLTAAETQIADAKLELQSERKQVLMLAEENASLKVKLEQAAKQVENQQGNLEEMHVRFKSEFQVLANSILEDKSQRFVDLNEEKIGQILTPLKEKITAFEKQVADVYVKETKEKSELKVELEKIVAMNLQMSEEAARLTSALKGDSKTQGDWGEMQLEMILEKAGLQNQIHYHKQNNFKSEDGKNLRPDYLIKLPQNKHIVLDAKVSLTAYERFFSATDENKRAIYLKQHVQSITKHIQDLSSKNYQNLDFAQPDYVLLFVPIEPALTCAIKENANLFEKTLEHNIVLVSTSTLLATLRTIAFIWTQENQQKNVLEIAKESGALYDKFVGFVDDLTTIGNRLDATQNTYKDAMNKLTEGRGNLVKRAEKIKKLGAKTTKQLDNNLIEN